MRLLSVVAFIGVFSLFSIAGFVWRINKEWYNSLKKPKLIPPGFLFAIVWPLLFIFISLSAAIIYNFHGFHAEALPFYIVLLLNFIFNQAFSYLQFKKRDLYLSAIDTSLVALSSLALILIAYPLEMTSSFLLIPYFLWSCFATYLAFSLYKLNK